jgi:acetyltransferase-like isoleucine patch superfamily enzyme
MSTLGKSLSYSRLFLAAMIEPVIRIMALFAPLLRRDQEGVEMALRGWILMPPSKCKIGRSTRFVGPPSRYQIGPCVSLYGNTYMNANAPTGLIEIGEHSHIDQFCVLYGQGGIKIGAHCAIASGVIIYSQTNADTRQDGTPVAEQPTVYAQVSIEDGCWLGAGVRIVPGVTLGEGCHVGAGAVVTGDLPPFSIAVGIPAKVIKQRSR